MQPNDRAENPSLLARRRFLASSLWTGGAIAAASATPGCAIPAADPSGRDPTARATGDFHTLSAARSIERHVTSACQFCNALCGLSVGVARGRVVTVEPVAAARDPVQAGNLCVKADLMAELVANGERLTTPLRRVGGRKGATTSRFEPISWDDALDLVADRFLALRDTGDGRAIANRTTGRMLRGAGELIGRLLTQLGSPNSHDVGPVCNDAGGDALRTTFGLGNFTNGYGVDPATGEQDLGSARYVLMFGTNQAETHPVTFAHVLRGCERTGAKLVVIDPRATPTSACADEHLGIRPGTDLAFALAMLGHIVERGLVDDGFVRDHVLGYDRLVDHLRERGYGPAWAAPLCDVPAERIARCAEDYARSGPAAIYCNAGVSHQVNAFATYRTLAILAAVTGNVGRPGSGCNFMHNTWPGGLGLPEWNATGPEPGPALPQGPDHFADAILDGAPYRLRAVMTQGNPLLSSANTDRVRAAFEQLEFYVYTGLFMEEAAWYADLILPVASGLEFDGVYMRRDDRAVRWQEQAVPRVGESRTDVEIFVGLAQALARRDSTEARSQWTQAVRPEWADYGVLWSEFVAHTPAMGGMTAQRLRQRGEPLRWPCPAADHPGVSTLYHDHPSWYAAAEALGAAEGQRFLTPSGKIECWTEQLERELAPTGHSALPIYFTHPETTGVHARLSLADDRPMRRNPVEPRSLTPIARVDEPGPSRAGDAFPLVGTTGRSSVVHFAGVTHWTPTGKRLDGVRLVQVHPKTLARFGVQDGAAILVESPRGGVRGTALAFDGIREDTVFVANGFGPAQRPFARAVGAPVHERAANTLLDHRHFDTLSGQQAYKCFACRIRPA